MLSFSKVSLFGSSTIYLIESDYGFECSINWLWSANWLLENVEFIDWWDNTILLSTMSCFTPIIDSTDLYEASKKYAPVTARIIPANRITIPFFENFTKLFFDGVYT